MGREPTKVWADRGLAIVTLDALTITYLSEPTSMPRMRAVREHLERHHAKWKDGTFALTVLSVAAVGRTPEAGVREESTAVARDFPALGNVIVVEGTGFASAATRALLTGIMLVARARAKIVGTLDEAAAWLSPLVTRAYGKPLDGADLRAAVDVARASLSPR